MEKGKKIIGRSILAATVLAVSGFTANAASLFNYNNMGTGEEVRTSLLNTNSSKSFELKCGGKAKADTTAKKGKDGKCGEGKCGGSKKKGKDGKCGANKKGS
ncbi:MAG: hypothetical protein KGO81_00870 [Bacteroidota bacterium]|nr:hypothetical protein [Bacteroidota bacterium]